MSLQRDDFATFFAAVRNGQCPFAWQERLLDCLLERGRWPDRVVAPTGTGKTAVIDVHVFANAISAVAGTPRLPRRLALVVDRRFVVDSHDEHAQAIAAALNRPQGELSGVLGAVAEALRSLRLQLTVAEDVPEPPPSALLTARLRGGAPPSRSWRDEPEACAVLACTPDMFGSRLLLQGYGSSPRAWPREAGLLAFDTAVVVDEAHLSRQLLMTARRVSELVTVPAAAPSVPSLQVVETTATPLPGRGVEVGVQEDDLALGGTLRDRLTTPKPVEFLTLPAWPLPKSGPIRAAAIEALVRAVLDLRAEFGPTVGCVVNRVPVAVDLTAALRKRDLTVEMLCGRLRPADVERLRETRPHLLDVQGDDEVDVLVATQTVEVGIDLDLSAMVTDLAPGTALAQRVGRVNRLGRRLATRVVVVVPDGELPTEGLGPYQHDDLAAAWRWLDRRVLGDTDLSPWRLRDDPPPGQELRRTLLQRLELADSWNWASTGDDLFARPDLALWLDDDLSADRDIGVAVRQDLPKEVDRAIALLRLLPPRRHEVFPAAIGAGRRLVAGLVNGDGGRALVLRVRREDVAPLGEDENSDLRPGDVLVFRSSVPILRGGVVPPDGEDPDQTADDVLEQGASGRQRGSLALRLGPGSWLPNALDGLDVVREEPDGPVDWPRERRRRLADQLRELAVPDGQISADLIEDVRNLLLGRVKDSDVVVQDDGDRAVRLIVIDRRRASADEDLRQTWTPARDAVGLDQHQKGVAVAAAELAGRLGLEGPAAERLRLAGLHHDDGKADRRFQLLLGAKPGGPLLAKSGRRSQSDEARSRAGSGLPRGWRHEQLSALETWRVLANSDPDERALVTRLAGTTHGHGRSGFPHSAAQLLGPGGDPGDDARELVDEGLWEEIVESTNLRYGVWGAAFLEALLRAADGRVSRAGS